VNVIDIAHSTRDYAKAFQKKYDAVFCMGVIEHVPHSPKGLLQSLTSVLRPGGCLLIDTPNLLYLYNRERLVRGQSVFAPIEDQFNADPPFEGHHREYTSDEVQWMLKSIGLHVDETELFNYSIYGLTELTGRDADYFRRMEASPANREYMMVRATTPAS